jgi:[ribosomal protein S18]-alanine N-acetyltransferase
MPEATANFMRQMTMSDLRAVSELDEICQPHPWGPANFQGELLRKEDGFNVVLTDGTALKGYLCCWMILDELHIGTVGIDPSLRRLGLARQLMLSGHDWARSCGGTIAHLEVRASNVSAIGLYQGLGYRQVGVRKAYYPDNQENALLLMADL